MCKPSPLTMMLVTGGILAGRLAANDSAFTITTLIIPKQQGTTDTVQVRRKDSECQSPQTDLFWTMCEQAEL